MFEIVTLILTPFQQNTRILACANSDSAVVIDPGGEVPRILEALERRKLTLEQIWLTHAHLDHCGGVAELKEATGAPLYGHKIEEELRANVINICRMYGLPEDSMQDCPEPEVYIAEGSTLSFSSYEFEVRFTPGHSPGHVIMYHTPSNTLIAGDTLFAGSVGRTDLPGGDYHTLMRSIKEQILTLPDETVVLSGHGPNTTIGVERGGNPFVNGL